MRSFFLFKLFILLLLLQLKVANVLAKKFQQAPPLQTDTILQNNKAENEDIEQIVKTKTPPPKDKVQYITQVTKYGFKNLFTKYSYNPSLSYSTQINPNATLFVQDYMRRNQKELLRMKGWGAPYFSLMENILSQYGLPRELKYIAVIESNLNIHETSRVGAAGPWQFMPYTARDFGLIVNSTYDERRDYYKSTDAAARYLLTLYKKFNDWLLVMAAYNGGPGRVNSAIKKSGSKNFWNLQNYLPEESRTYVKRFIATHYIMEGTGGVTTVTNNNAGIENDNNNISIKKITGTKALNYFDTKPQLSNEELETTATQTISGKYNSIVIAKNLAMDIVQFNHYNPSFDNLISSAGSYDLRLPQEKMQIFIANKYTILNECVQILFKDNSLGGNTIIYNSTKNNSTKQK